MTISGYPPATLIKAASGNEEAAPNDAAVRLLKKAQDQMKQEGEALLKLVESSGSHCSNCQHLDVYA